jgi:hypothetical protein
LFLKAGNDASASNTVVTDTTRNIDSEVQFKIWMYRKGPATAPSAIKVVISQDDQVTAKFTLRDYELKATDVKAHLEAVAGGRYSVFKAEVSAKHGTGFGEKTTIEGYTTVNHTWTKQQAIESFESLDPCLEDKIYFHGGLPSMGQATGYATQCMLEILNSLTDPNGRRLRYFGNSLTQGKECTLQCRVKLYPAFAFTDSKFETGFRRYTKIVPDGNKSETASKLWFDTGVVIGTGENALARDCNPDSIPGRAAYKAISDSISDDKELKKQVLGDDALQCTFHAMWAVLPSGWREWHIPVFKDKGAWWEDPKVAPNGQPLVIKRKLTKLELAQLTTELIAANRFSRTDDGAWPDMKKVCDLLWEKTKGDDPLKWSAVGSFVAPFPVLRMKPPPEGAPGQPVEVLWLTNKLVEEYTESDGGYPAHKPASAPFKECQTIDAFGNVTKAP